MRSRIFVYALLAALLPRAASAADGLLDEVQVGALAHDVAIGVHHQEDGTDGNAELLFVSPAFLAPIFAPRPHLGIEVNSLGKNSYAYAGLTWHVGGRVFAELGLGGAVHDGPDATAPLTHGHAGLGTRALFHESVEAGVRLSAAWSVALYIDHVSNADLSSRNPGLTDLGARIGDSF